ncbi:MAG: glycosyltransferase family 2 protein [Pseudomonadota bacterium]
MTDNLSPEICVIIPARNEALSIAQVVKSVPGYVSRTIVVDNGSSDGTGEIAQAAGARVVRVKKPGYGRSCLAGIEAADDADILVFMDGDGADNPDDMAQLVAPIIDGEKDFVVGARTHGQIEKGALTPQQRYGNALACFLMRVLWGGHFTDLGPFRAIRKTALARLDMENETFGWTVEMQVRALKLGVAYGETPVSYRKRIGQSKISGTVKGVVLAGAHILGVIAREAMRPPSRKREDA